MHSSNTSTSAPIAYPAMQKLNDSTVANDLRAAATLPETAKSPVLQDLMRKLIKSKINGETASVSSSNATQTFSQSRVKADSADLSFLSPAQAPDEIGRLNGYRILKKLGEGGMGMVFEAQDVRLKRRVALKVMKPEIAKQESHRARFLREAQTAATVEHDHICPIYQVGEENGVPFYCDAVSQGRTARCASEASVSRAPRRRRAHRPRGRFGSGRRA